MSGSVNPGSGVAGVGGNQVLPFRQRQTRTILGDDVVWGAGGHSLKFGVEYERQTTLVDLPLFGDGAWTFPSLTAFLQNQPSLFLGALPGATDAARNIEEWRIASYVHDEWRLANRVTLNLGLRYDPRSIPTLDKAAALVDLAQSTGFTNITQAFSRNPTLRNWEPRVGMAFDPFGDRKTSIRAGYGIFHSPITANRLGPAYALNPPFALGAQVRLPFPPVPVFPTPNPAASQISQMQALDFDMQDSPRLHQWNVNVQREVLSGTSVTLAYVGSRGDHLQRQRDTNPVTPRTLPDGTVVYGSRNGAQTISNPRVNAQFAALVSANSYAKSDYDSFQAALNRRFSSNVQSQLSYTLSRCRDTTSGNSLFEGGTAATNPYNEEYDYGLVPDRSHAQLTGQRDLPAAVQGQCLCDRLAGVGDCQRRQRRAVHAARRIRSGRPADRRHAASEPGGWPLARRRGDRRATRYRVRLHHRLFRSRRSLRCPHRERWERASDAIRCAAPAC